ncbi:MAG: CotH kinase family protein [Saprospiraceae bacterium]|nr:CotH kinase family protein [Saprospiraceae bacterium]MCF8249046.1 CotH kinase family protein [Saprospiraceae bacterium]MCF8282717.1 CotH kinase family protein [Bacteroidales bacterium]MCF8311068.1 CotH kinase family protein [Saprospiraceae bacterium]MCF8443087.1 CotH kinase family protein [Saprospiraceae bacterium]
MRITKPTIGLLAAFFCFAITPSAQVVINEYTAANLSTTLDNYGKYEDWVEFYNPDTAPADISNYQLSDNPDKPDKWKFPQGTAIPANGYLVVWLSGRDEAANGHIHANFKLTQTKGTPERLIFSNATGVELENKKVKKLQLGQSAGRKTDFGMDWGLTVVTTPGASNNAVYFYEDYVEDPDFDMPAGFYQDSVVVTITCEDSTAIIRYTTNGNLPTANSTIYTGPITLHETKVIKAIAFSNDPLLYPSFLEFSTYFINVDYTLPVVSASGTQLLLLANGNQNLRPKGSFELFGLDKTRTAKVTGELNSHGQDSWVNSQRSIDWVSRDEMGEDNAIEELLFPGLSLRDEFQRVIMRAAGDDNYPGGSNYTENGQVVSANVRDAYVHNLAYLGDMHLDVRLSSKCIVFFNGQYWGVYDLRSLPDEHDHTEYEYNQGKYDLEYLLTWGNTWAQYDANGMAFQNWENLYNFVENNDMADPANYAYVESQLDVVSLCDYFIANSFTVASDWLNWNTGWWRGLNPEGTHQKWGYILWDLDATFAYYINYTGIADTSATALPCNPEIIDLNDWWDPQPQRHINLINKLQESPAFRQFYITRQADLAKSMFSCENMLTYLDTIVATIAPEMPSHIIRWGGSMQQWLNNVERLRYFIERRCESLAGGAGINDCYETTGPYDVVLMTDPPNAGTIQANSLIYNQLPTNSPFFGNIETLLDVTPADPTFTFSFWKSTNHAFTDSSLAQNSLTLTQPDTITAVFNFMPSATHGLQADQFQASVLPTVFTQQFTVSYNLPAPGLVSMRLLDVAGREVADLFSDLRMNAGDHLFGFDTTGKGIAPGVYFLNIKVDGVQRTLKLVKQE